MSRTMRHEIVLLDEHGSTIDVHRVDGLPFWTEDWGAALALSGQLTDELEKSVVAKHRNNNPWAFRVPTRVAGYEIVSEEKP